MIYTDMTIKAMQLSYQAHQNQFDKGGVPYVFHPFHVAEQMTDELTTTIALLHDVVEDTWVTLDYLKQEGFPPEVIEAVDVLTRDLSMDYMDYIREVKKHPVACRVKLEDLRHNSDPTRLPVRNEATENLLEKYKIAIRLIEQI